MLVLESVDPSVHKTANQVGGECMERLILSGRRREPNPITLIPNPSQINSEVEHVFREYEAK